MTLEHSGRCLAPVYSSVRCAKSIERTSRGYWKEDSRELMDAQIKEHKVMRKGSCGCAEEGRSHLGWVVVSGRSGERYWAMFSHLALFSTHRTWLKFYKWGKKNTSLSLEELWKDGRRWDCRWDFPMEVVSMEGRDAGSQHSLIRGRKTGRESRGSSLQKWGHTWPWHPWSPSLSLFDGQEVDLEHQGNFAHPTVLGSKVNVFRGLGAGHGEVLEDGGEEEE